MEKKNVVQKETIFQAGFALLGILILGVFLSYILSPLQALRIISALLFALVLPGMLLGYIIFKKGSLDAIERIVLSFVFSLVVVPMPLFFVSKIGIKITTQSSFVVILILNIVFTSILLYQYKKLKK